MAYGVILGQTPAPPASNVSYNNSGTSGTISSTNVQGALDNIVTKTNSLQSQINTTNSNLTSNVNNLQGQINSLSSQIGSGLKANLVVNESLVYQNATTTAFKDISFTYSQNLLGIFIQVSGSATFDFTSSITSSSGNVSINVGNCFLDIFTMTPGSVTKNFLGSAFLIAGNCLHNAQIEGYGFIGGTMKYGGGGGNYDNINFYFSDPKITSIPNNFSTRFIVDGLYQVYNATLSMRNANINCKLYTITI